MVILSIIPVLNIAIFKKLFSSVHLSTATLVNYYIRYNRIFAFIFVAGG